MNGMFYRDAHYASFLSPSRRVLLGLHATSTSRRLRSRRMIAQRFRVSPLTSLAIGLISTRKFRPVRYKVTYTVNDLRNRRIVGDQLLGNPKKTSKFTCGYLCSVAVS